MGYKDKEKTKAYQKFYRETHKEESKIYYEARKYEKREYSKRYKDAHEKEMKAYREAHKKERSIYSKLYYKTHKEKVSEKGKLYYKIHKDKKNAYGKLYRKAFPEIGRRGCRRHKALKLRVAYENYTTNYIFERDNWICGICGRKINRRLRHPNPLSPSIDHIQPLSKGGWDSPVNVQAAHLRCNIGKSATNKGQLRLFG